MCELLQNLRDKYVRRISVERVTGVSLQKLFRDCRSNLGGVGSVVRGGKFGKVPLKMKPTVHVGLSGWLVVKHEEVETDVRITSGSWTLLPQVFIIRAAVLGTVCINEVSNQSV